MDEDVGTGVGPSERAPHAGGGGSTPERRRRMSARRKQDAVLRLLRGEDLELLSRQLGVTAADLSGWRGAFLAAGEMSLKTRPADARDAEIGRLKATVGDLTMANELLEAKIERLETSRPLAPRKVEAMSRQVSPSTVRVYGLQRVTQIWGVSRATLPPSPLAGGDRAPAARAARCDGGRGAGAGDRRLLQDSPFHGEGYRKLWARPALCRHPLQPAPRPAADARARSAGASARGRPHGAAGGVGGVAAAKEVIGKRSRRRDRENQLTGERLERA